MPMVRPWPALALLVLLPGALAAQRVSADIVIGHGPVAGRVIVGDPYPHHTRSALVIGPRYHMIVTHRPRGHGWYRRHGYRAVRVWYDDDCGRYYQRYDRNHPGLRAVVVYERGGRYYSEDDRRRDRHDRRHDDRWDRD